MRKIADHGLTVGNEIVFLTNAGTGTRPTALATVTRTTKTLVETSIGRTVDYRRKGLRPRIATNEDREYLAQKAEERRTRERETADRTKYLDALRDLFPDPKPYISFSANIPNNGDTLSVKWYSITADQVKAMAQTLREMEEQCQTI